MFKAVVTSLVSGAFAVTSAEYFFKYNLLDLLKDKLQGLVGRLPFFKLGDTPAALIVLSLFVVLVVLVARA